VEAWSFELELSRPPTGVEIDALYEAGLDDATVATRTLGVDREAPSLLDAVVSVLQQLAAVADLHAVALVDDDAVTLQEAGQRLAGVRSAESLRQHAAGARGSGGFPRPVMEAGKVSLYSWGAVLGYLRGLGDDVPQRSPERALIDRALRLHHEAMVAGQGEAVGRLLAAA